MEKKVHSIPRLKELYYHQIIPQMMEKSGYPNALAVPRVEKIVINIGVNEAKENIKILDVVTAEIAAITGQHPQVRRAKKSISSFKLRAGMPIGLRVTLRGDRMYEFLERLITMAIPRIRDFHGLSPQAFDKRGNYNLGLSEQYIFPEIEVEKSDHPRGMNITLVTTASSDKEGRDLLSLLGMPFRQK